MKRLAWLATLALSVLCRPESTLAIALNFVPPSQTVPVGAAVSTDVVVSDLGTASVGAFELDVAFNPAQLAAATPTFGLFLGDPLRFDALVTSSVDNAVGRVHVADVSLLPASQLDALQPASFSLVTLRFTALAVGTSALTLSNILLEDPAGNPLNGVAGSGSVTVIPEPSTWLLFGSALAALGVVARRQKR